MMAWDGNYANMTDLLTNSTRRTNLANDIAATVAARNADGVNLDFEPMPNSLESPYTAFVRELKAALGDGYSHRRHDGRGGELGRGLRARRQRRRQRRQPRVGRRRRRDHGHGLRLQLVRARRGPAASRRSSARTPSTSTRRWPPTAARSPRRGSSGACPYYGRAWTTVDDALNASGTCASAGGCDAASWAFRYVDAVEALETRTRRWDATGQVPWYTYPSTTYDTDVQAYYEDATSLGRKYDLVDGHGLRGVGIWHLLMDVGRARALERARAQLQAAAVQRHRGCGAVAAHRVARRGGDRHRLRRWSLLPVRRRPPRRDGRLPGPWLRPARDIDTTTSPMTTA